ncbi:hypothetical protein LguiA_001877 [Lonicera macranthoides]
MHIVSSTCSLFITFKVHLVLVCTQKNRVPWNCFTWKTKNLGWKDVVPRKINSLENLHNQTSHKVNILDSWVFSMEYKCNQTHP